MSSSPLLSHGLRLSEPMGKPTVEQARVAPLKLRGDFFRLDEQSFAGYVADEGDLN